MFWKYILFLKFLWDFLDWKSEGREKIWMFWKNKKIFWQYPPTSKIPEIKIALRGPWSIHWSQKLWSLANCMHTALRSKVCPAFHKYCTESYSSPNLHQSKSQQLGSRRICFNVQRLEHNIFWRYVDHYGWNSILNCILLGL